jgi:16S rRNA (cytosine1402-N4)-methyltransferase
MDVACKNGFLKVKNFVHKPVMLNETLEGLNLRKGLIYVDATAGGAGHSKEIAARISPDGKLIAIDTDPIAIETATKNLEPYREIVTIVKANYSELPVILRDLNIEKITGGILFDLGASYYQLTSEERGFSFLKESFLDMRFNPDSQITAYDIINNWSEPDLVKIFSEYGEERYSKRIAKSIIENRNNSTIKTTTELANIVKSAVPAFNSKIHPATRIFQALRIAVNNELKNFENSLKQVVPLLAIDARIAVISFHSLEDRLVKNLFKYYSSNCRCSAHELICKCKPAQIEVLTKKPIIASKEEIKHNPPSRSAKLRIARKSHNGVE